MIALYPLLVSNTISKNIIPGIAKVLENYIIVYGLDGLLTRVRKDSKISGDYSIRLNKVLKQEDIEKHLPGFLYREILEEQSGIYNHPDVEDGSKEISDDKETRKDRLDRLKTASDIAKNRMAVKKGQAELGAMDVKDASVRIEPYNMQSVSLEPTWMKIDQFDKDGNKSTGLIGVKVVPYAVKSDASLASLLMYDNQVGKMQRHAILFGRKITSFLYRSWMKTWKTVTLGLGGRDSSTVTGDPRKDILLKRNILQAGHAQDIFVVANQAELSDDFYKTAKGMRNLQKMGWGSVIIADDVNRRVAFCMHELRGLCSLLPYTMLYQTFSQAKVYEDIEDAKRNASSIFKVKRVAMTKLIGESIAQNKIEKFGTQELPMFEKSFITEMEYIDEGIADFIKSITPMKIKALFTNIAHGNLDKIPVTTTDKLLQYGMKINPEFKKGHILAKNIILNSTSGISEKMADLGALICCSHASFGNSDFMTNVKESLKKMIALFRRIKKKRKNESPPLPPEHYMDAVFGWSAIVILFTSLGYFGFKQAQILKMTWEFIQKMTEFIQGFSAPSIMATVKEFISEIPVSEFMTTQAPPIVLGIFVAAYIWSLIKGR